MAPDETTSGDAPTSLNDPRLLIEAARRLARRRRRQDRVLAGAVVVVVLTIALASTGVFRASSSRPVAFTPVVVPGGVMVPGGASVPCAPAAVVVIPGKGPGQSLELRRPAIASKGAWTTCVMIPPGPLTQRITVWRSKV